MKVSEPTTNTAEELQTDSRWQLVQRIVSSSPFARSSRLSSFLLYVSQRAIQGQTDHLNEQEIGVKVFGRSEGYLQSDDNIVRANASRLRQRLEEYFASEGQFETLRVTLPKGGYVPEFTTLPPQPVHSEIESVPEPGELISSTQKPVDTPERPASIVWKLVALVSLVLLVIVSTLALLGRTGRPSRGLSADGEKTASSYLWANIFDAKTPTLVVPADSSLVLYRSMTHRDINLGEYINGEYRVKADDGSDDPKTARGIARRRLTSISDLEFIAGVVPKIQQTDRKMVVRYARDLQTQDFRQSNIILLGARYANPWVSLMDSQRQYALLFDEATRMVTITDRSRQPDELVKYHPGQPEDLAYALVAYVPNFTQGKHVLILEGTSIAGTEAAVNFILASPEFDSLLSKHMKPNGGVSNFELVIQSRDFSGTSSNSRVIASRFF